MSHARMTTLYFLLLALSPFVIFDSDYALISRPFCKSNTLWNSLMTLVSSPDHEVLMVSCCGQLMSVVRRASSVVRRASSVVRRPSSVVRCQQLL